jgi:hypothetical protein
MSIKRYLETSEFLPIEQYQSADCNFEECIAFTGSLRRHPYDDDKIVLIYHAFRDDPLFFEFKLNDIRYIEEMPNIVTESGENLATNKVWIQKGSLAVKYDAFEVNAQNCREYTDTSTSRKTS